MKSIVQKNKKTRQFFWVQEESENMGGWFFIRPRLEKLIGKPIEYIGRKASSSPATGFPHIYRQDQAAIVDEAVGPKALKKK